MPDDYNSRLATDIAGFAADPLGYVRYNWAWGEGDLVGLAVRQWQAKFLRDLGDHLSNPATRHTPFLAAIASGHGIGKSTTVSWLSDWALDTCVDTKVVVTANTGTQLSTKTQPEMEKWLKGGLTGKWKQVNATSVRMLAKGHETLWRADLIPWSKNNPQAFAGLHNFRKRVLVIFDEASEIDDIIWDTASKALTDEETELLWVVFGNPTLNTGRFRECFGKFKHRWKRYQVDARTVEGVNKAEIQKDIDDFGEDSDFVRIRWRGEFPRAGSNQLISSDDVEKARKYRAMGFEHMPKIMSVDVARYGDDQSVIGKRQGRFSTIMDKMRKNDVVAVARQAMFRAEQESPDAIVVDGDGLGAGVVDYMRSHNYEVHEFHGGSTPDDPRKYFNRRAEVWGTMAEWLRAGAQIDDDPELAQDLIGPKYGFSASQQVQLERKEDMKKRGLASPDSGDMLAMTFDVKLSSRAPVNKAVTEYVYPGQQGQTWMGG